MSVSCLMIHPPLVGAGCCCEATESRGASGASRIHRGGVDVESAAPLQPCQPHWLLHSRSPEAPCLRVHA